MLNVTANIEKNHQIDLIVWGAILVLGALLGLGRGFGFLVGVVLIAQGIVRFGAVNYLMDKLNIKI